MLNGYQVVEGKKRIKSPMIRMVTPRVIKTDLCLSDSEILTDIPRILHRESDTIEFPLVSFSLLNKRNEERYLEEPTSASVSALYRVKFILSQ